MYQLYYCRGKASLTPHMLLEELDVPYQLVPIDVKNNQHKTAQYLALNPMGQIPLLIDLDVKITETAAICLYLSDKHPEKNFAPALGTTKRGLFYKWLFFLTSNLQAELMIYFNPQHYSESDKAGVKVRAYENISGMLDLIENQLVENQSFATGPYFLGKHCSAVDLLLLMLSRWTSDLAYPARVRPCLNKLLNLVVSRPAVIRAFNDENIVAPYF